MAERHRGNRNAGLLEMTDEERERRTKDAVRDLPEQKRRKLTAEDVQTLRDAGLEELAEIAERHIER